MNYKLTQRQIKLNEQVLQGLYEEYSKLRKARKEYNEEADAHLLAAQQRDEYENFEGAAEAQQAANDYREQARVFTPFIKKFKAKIAKLNEVQKALKHDVKCQMCLADWTAEDDAFWLAQAEVAQQEGFVEPYDQSEAIAGTLGVV